MVANSALTDANAVVTKVLVLPTPVAACDLGPSPSYRRGTTICGWLAGLFPAQASNHAPDLDCSQTFANMEGLMTRRQ